jgi:hypothetical protein
VRRNSRRLGILRCRPDGHGIAEASAALRTGAPFEPQPWGVIAAKEVDGSLVARFALAFDRLDGAAIRATQYHAAHLVHSEASAAATLSSFEKTEVIRSDGT